MLDNGTRNKVEMYGGDYSDELLRHIDEDNLPRDFGGKTQLLCNNNEYIMEYGVWNNYQYEMPKESIVSFQNYLKNNCSEQSQLDY